MVVTATDLGQPPLTSEVLVVLNIVDRANRPPVWDQQVYDPKKIPENISVGQTVYSIKARLVVGGGWCRPGCCQVTNSPPPLPRASHAPAGPSTTAV